METILIATDFSPAAKNATRYGLEFSKAINARVILFNAYSLHSTHAGSLAYLPPVDLEKLSNEQLAVEDEALSSLTPVPLETQSLEGPAGEAILCAATASEASFIIVGMKGYGKEIRRYLGSTVTALSKQSSIPLIVVPEEASFSVPENIALASDIHPELNVLKPLRMLAETFNSKVFIVRVIKNAMEESFEKLIRPTELEWFFNRQEHAYKYVKEENVARGMNNFVERNAVDLVAVMPHEHTLMERLFVKSTTKDLIFGTHVPLLILPPQPAVEEQPDCLQYTSLYFPSVS